MANDKKKRQDVLQEHWGSFLCSVESYLARRSSVNDLHDIWINISFYLFLRVYDLEPQCSYLINSNEVSEFDYSTELSSEQVKSAVLEKDDCGNFSIICREREEGIFWTGADTAVSREITRGRFYIGLIGSFKDTAREQIKVVCDVVLRFLGECIYDLNVILKDHENESESEWDKKIAFDFISWYKQSVFHLYQIPEEAVLLEIASLRYEKRDFKAGMYLVCEQKIGSLFDNTQNDGLIVFQERTSSEYTIVSEKVSAVRKMLEVCSNSGCFLLVSNVSPFELKGIVAEDRLAEVAQGCLSIIFMGRGDWKLCRDSHSFLVYRNRHYYSNDDLMDIELDRKISDMKLLTMNQRQMFKRIFQKLNDQEHGALMIVAQDAEEEAKRLCGNMHRGSEIREFHLLSPRENLDRLDGIASIDGAVLVDFEGRCYGFGAILDGEAVVDGDVGRGARFNSARNYIAGKNRYAVVVSEDKERGIEIVYPEGINLSR